MCYARLSTEKEFEKILTSVNEKKEIKKSGIQMMYKNKEIYIDDSETHSLIIGGSGSGKHQAIVYPLIRTAIKAEESIIINDVNGEICKKMGSTLKDAGYNIVVLDLKNSEQGNCWNPLTLAYKLYKGDKKNEGVKLLETIGYHLFNDSEVMDPFWINSATDYFTGLSLYLFENAKEEEISINSIFSLSNKINEDKNLDKFLKKLDKNSNIYYNLSGTLTAPTDTRGGIISTFIEKIKRFISSESLSNMLSNNDFDMKTITKEKTVIFLLSGINSREDALVPLFVSEVIYAIDNYSTNNRRLNIILDEFDELNPIKGLSKILTYSRPLSIRFTILLRDFKGIESKYGKETTEILKSSFYNIIYLWSNDLNTLEEISKLCGNTQEKNKEKPLISVEKLKTLAPFEAIILKQRMMPFKTKLLPDWKMNWAKSNEEYKINPIKKHKLNPFEIKLN